MDEQMNQSWSLLANLSLFYFNRTNISIDEYLLISRGPKQLPLNIAVPFTIFNVLIFVTGIVGNISVCVVIIRHSSMHTATNYYLFSLAVSDLTLLLFGKLILLFHIDILTRKFQFEFNYVIRR